MLVSGAVTQLGFDNQASLEKFAKENPTKLRLKNHPTHGRRRQAHKADVLTLAMQRETDDLDRLDSPQSSKLPSISEDGLTKLVDRMTQTRSRKEK